MSGAAPAGRLAWLDLARGLSITLVVLYHVAVGAGADLLGSSPPATWWREASLALVPLRMPLFFAVAGMLAARALTRPWSAVLRPRIGDMLWTYVLFSAVFAATGWPRYAIDNIDVYLRGELTGMLVVASPYWFIAALPIFFVICRLLRRVPGVLVVIASAMYAIDPWARQLLGELGAPRDFVYGTHQILDNFLWFVLGAVLSALVLHLAETTRPLPRGVLGGTLLAGFILLAVVRRTVLEGTLAQQRGLELSASLCGIAALVLLLPVLARWAPAARFGALLGSRTLMIYLIHPLVLNIVVVIWRRGELARPGALLGDLLLVPAITAIAIGASLGVEAARRRWGPRWLTALPGGRAGAREEQQHRSGDGPGRDRDGAVSSHP